MGKPAAWKGMRDPACRLRLAPHLLGPLPLIELRVARVLRLACAAVEGVG